MTRKEFAKKYNVDYNLVAIASRQVKVCNRQKNVQFDENELGKAVCQELRGRINRNLEASRRLHEDYDRLSIICWNMAL